MPDNPYAMPRTRLLHRGEHGSNKTARAGLARLMGALVAMLALPGCLLSALALSDPQGTQLSNDAAPFATPPAMGETWLYLALWLSLFCIGTWLLFRRGPR